MTIDTGALLQSLQGIDLTSAAIGAALARGVEAAVKAAVTRVPGLVVGLLKARVQRLAAAGKIDGPTMKLLKAYAQATFDWVDEELPDEPGPAKMQAALDRLAAVPYVGLVVRANRAGVQEVLQAAYNAIDQEAKAQKAALQGGQPDGKATPTAAPAAPAGAAPPAAQPPAA